MRFLILPLLLVLGCADADAPSDGEDAAALPAAPEVPGDLSALGSPAVETLVADAPVHVHHVTLAPGDSLAPHQGGERAVYALSDLDLRLTTDGEADERTFAEGDVHRHDAGIHAVGNVGASEARFVVFERVGTLPAAAAEDDTAVPTPGAGAADEVLLDDDVTEVHRVTLEPGAQLPPHQGYARAIYALSGYTVEFTGPDGAREQRFEAGEAHYHDPGDHTVENAGDTVAEFLVVEFKR